MEIIDIEKVIKGLEMCTKPTPSYCRQCPYRKTPDDYPHCVHDRLQQDALALLKEQRELMLGMITKSNAKCTERAIHFRRLVLCKDCVKYEQETGRCKNMVAHGNAETWFCADGERR